MLGYAQKSAAVVTAEASGNYRMRYDAMRRAATRGAIMARVPSVSCRPVIKARFCVSRFNNAVFS